MTWPTVRTLPTRRSRLRLLLGGITTSILASVGLYPQPAQGQAAQSQRPPPALPNTSLVAYLVTVGPGDAVWERFGHSLIWIHDPKERTDEAYNYGLFSFEQEHFLLRFIMGHMDYWVAGFDVQRQLAAYRSQNRSIEIQRLALAPAQVRRLQEFLEWNVRPENRFYRYQYYRDNCSTRVRDALDRILGGQLGRWARARVTDASYRDHTLRLTHDLFWASVGMDFGLGPSADRPLTAWQAMFVPMEMAEELRHFTVRTESGDSTPFIDGDRAFYQASRPPIPDATPRRIGIFLPVGILMAALFWWLGGRQAAAGFLSLAVPWLLFVGLLGSLVAFLWAFTGHVDARWNANLLQASPLHLTLAFLLWPLARGRDWARRFGRWIALAVAAMACLGIAVAVATEVLPVVDQSNAPFLALLFPPNLALTWVAWRMSKTEVTSPRRQPPTEGRRRNSPTGGRES